MTLDIVCDGLIKLYATIGISGEILQICLLPFHSERSDFGAEFRAC